MRFFNRKPKHPYVKALLIGTAVVLFWRGLWGLLDIYLFPENQFVSYVVSIAVGLIVLAVTHTWVKELE